jgi:hypothetical protein
MRQADFLGDFRKIAPSKLVGDEPDEIEDFFLVLAVIYNDLKGLVYFDNEYKKNHKLPERGEISAYAGEYGGMTTQLYKLVAGMINEFLIFLKNHENVYFHPRFQLILLRLPKAVKIQWNDILDAAFERSNKNDSKSIGYKLMLIRNHVAFHYHQSEKVLRPAYQKFFADKNLFGADHAYYSDGGNLQLTRYYYADAAVQRYLFKTANDQNKMSYESDLAAYNKLQSETFLLVTTMNMVLANLLRQFIVQKNKELT